MPCPGQPSHTQRGFTLVELIVSITLLALLAVAVVPMLQLPLRAYVDSTRRADLAAELSVISSKLNEDLRQALPGSLRVGSAGGNAYVEYLALRAVGRYRGAAALPATAPICPASCNGGANRDLLQFGAPDNCLATLGPLQGGQPVAGSDYVVVNPLGAAAGAVYQGGAAANGRKARLQGLSSSAGSHCLRVANNTFTLPPTGRQVYLVAEPVSYVCNPNTGTLTRYWGYNIAAVQPTAFGAGVASAPLGQRVGGCSFSLAFTGPPGAPTGQLLSLSLRLSSPVQGSNATEVTDSLLTFGVKEAL